MHWGRSARDHKSRCRLRTVAFGIVELAREANVQHSRIGRRVWNGPIVIFGVRSDRRRNARRESPAAIQRQPNFHLASARVNLGESRGLRDPDSLPRVENLSKPPPFEFNRGFRRHRNYVNKFLKFFRLSVGLRTTHQKPLGNLTPTRLCSAACLRCRSKPC
jgi:hypothetical protein